MANDLNRCEFIGRLGKDPEASFMPNGNAVTKISIAVGEQWKDKQTGHKQERTTWIPVVAFGRLAEVMGQYLAKGSKVYLAGKFSVRKWQGQDGQDRYTTEIVANEMQMLDSRGGGGDGNYGGGYGGGQGGGFGGQDRQGDAGGGRQPGQQGGGNQGGFSAPADDFDDDIPF